MASTATTRLRLEKQGAGENASTWGTKLNSALDRLDESIAGTTSISTTGGTTTLSSNNFNTDQSRAAILLVTGVLSSNAIIQIPAVSKVYLVRNSTSGAFTVTVNTASGTGAICPRATAHVMCDGTNCFLTPEAATASASGVVTLASTAEAQAGTEASKVLTPATAAAAITALAPGALVAIIQYREAQNTSPAAYGVSRTRSLNTLVYNRDTLVSLATNQFTLPAGTWEIEWFCPCGASNATHQAVLYDVTATSNIGFGTSGQFTGSDQNDDPKTAYSKGSQVVTIASSRAYEIRHLGSGTQGNASNLATEVYAEVKIRRA